jgi:hypothetical protein
MLNEETGFISCSISPIDYSIGDETEPLLRSQAVAKMKKGKVGTGIQCNQACADCVKLSAP